MNNSFEEAFEMYKDLIEEQRTNALSLILELDTLEIKSMEELGDAILLDALALSGLQLVEIAGENIPGLAYMKILQEELEEE